MLGNSPFFVGKVSGNKNSFSSVNYYSSFCKGGLCVEDVCPWGTEEPGAMLKDSLVVLYATAFACPQNGVQRLGINAYGTILKMNC